LTTHSEGSLPSMVFEASSTKGVSVLVSIDSLHPQDKKK
jgi:hypothetical protein